MDFITHSLVGAGLARVLSPRRKWLPQLSLAGLAGSLLMDGDSWLYLIGPNYYGRYHRVLSHSLVVLGPTVLVGATLAWSAGAVRPWRRFGWFVADNLPLEESIDRPPWALFLLITALAAGLHWCFDAITGFGNMCPLWPWSMWDASLHAVSSFDPFILAGTLAWCLTMRYKDSPPREARIFSAIYLLLVILYVAVRLRWATPSII